MRKYTAFAGMLAIATILASGFTACSNDDLSDNTIQQTKPKRVHVTVGAGITDDDTRSEVENDGTTRTLKFTEGDKLYVFAPVSKNATNDGYIIMAGKLDIVPATISDGTSASFSGDLDLYEWDSSQDKYVSGATHTFSTENPLKECYEFSLVDDVYPYNVRAQLIHKGTESAFIVENNPENVYEYLSNFYYYYVLMPSDVDALMTGYLNVKSDQYDGINERFNLASDNHKAIFNCTISGLTAMAEYKVEVHDNDRGHIRTNSEGFASFAFDYKEDDWGTEKAYSIVLINTANLTDTYTIDLGTRTLQKKIYNVTRHWNGTMFSKPMTTVKSEDVGKVIGADGCIYTNATDATTAGTTAQAMIAYVGTQDGVCDHGLAISLTNAYEYNVAFVQAAGYYIIANWANSHTVRGGTWHLPSEQDWQYMMWGYYVLSPVATNISSFNTKLNNVGTALPGNTYFWTSTEVDDNNAKAIYYDGTYAGITNLGKTENVSVRACLAF